MIGSFSFNNVESSTFNLVCKSVKRPLLPAVKTKRLDLPGLSGAYDFPGKEYSLRSVVMSITYIGDTYEELRTRARSIAAWLAHDIWARLIFNDEPDKYYLAKVTEEISLESLWESGSAEVVFDCQPFAYSLDESIISFTATEPKSEIFAHPGTRLIDYKSPYGGKFLIKVAGSWSAFTLAMNGKVLNYNQAGNGTVIFDNIEMEVTYGGVNKFSVLTGDIDTFLHILPGDNLLSISGTNLNVTVTIEFIPMWI